MSKLKMKPVAALLFPVFLLAACKAGPDYKRPQMALPQTLPATQAEAGKSISEVGDQWWQLYGDDVLDKLEDEALAHNADIQVAAARVEEVRAQLGITEADQYPVVTANISGTRTKYSQTGSFPRPTQNLSHAALDASFELDLWGKLRRASEAARANLLSAQSAKETVRLSLTAQVAQQYFSLLSLDAQEAALKKVFAGRQERLELGRKQLEVGMISGYDLQQIEADEGAAQAQLAATTLARTKQEAALALLLGRSPREVIDADLKRGTPSLPVAAVPEGLSADLLLRRPDVKDAEERLISMNASIGVARAQYFPSISLTSYLGSESTQLANMFTGPSGIFQFAANISQPIFNVGRLGYQEDAAKARRDQALIQYKQAVASAFADVRNALTAQATSRQVLAAEKQRSDALEQSYRQAQQRFNLGAISRPDLLDVEKNYLLASLNRIDAERAQRSAVADLFKAMGGGWKAQATASK